MAHVDASIGPDTPQASDGSDLRVMLFLKGYGTGGVERIALRLSEGLRHAGLNLAVVVTASGPMCPSASRYDVIDSWPIFGARWPLARLVVALWRRIRRAPPAVLFCPGNAYTFVAVLLKLLLGNACPPIVAKVSNDLQRRDLPYAIRPFYHGWLRMQGRMIDHFAVLSNAMADEVMALMRVDPHRVHLVPNPVLDSPPPVPVQDSSHTQSTGRRFVAVGRLEPQKNYPAMLRAFAAGAGADDRLTIFGEGGQRPALAALATSLGIRDRVDMPGHCRDVAARLADHDVLLLSSSYEGLPGVIVEALAAGLWVIATRCCVSMPDLLDHGALGTLVECGDESDFARAIATAEPGPQDRARAARKVRDYTVEAAVPAYVALFAAVTAERQARNRVVRKAPVFHPASPARSA